jgi:hypothetical protein
MTDKSATPRTDSVICPNCAHQFQAISVDHQRELSDCRAKLERKTKELDLARTELAFSHLDVDRLASHAEREGTGPYWLIERGSPAEWWVGGMPEVWTKNAFEAQRFNQWGAETHAKELESWGVQGPLRATEHLDLTEPSPAEREEAEWKPCNWCDPSFGCFREPPCSKVPAPSPAGPDALAELLRDIQSNAAIGEPEWEGINQRIESFLRSRPADRNAAPKVYQACAKHQHLPIWIQSAPTFMPTPVCPHCERDAAMSQQEPK